MKKILFTCLILASSLVVFSQEKIVVDPNASLRSLNGKHFTSIEVSHAIKLIITQASEESIAVSANEESFKADIVTELDGSTLKIYSKNNHTLSGRRGRKLTVYVSFTRLSSLEASGATDVVAVGPIVQPALKIELSGASTLKAGLQLAELKAELSGASKALFTGTAANAKLECNGASDLDALKLSTDHAYIEASGASDIEITVNKELRADASGASSIRYKGNADIQNVKTSGASSIGKID